MLKGVVAGGIAAAIIAGAAHGQDAPKDGFYLRAGAGVSFVNDLNQEFSYNPDLVSLVTPPSSQRLDVEAGFVANAAIGFYYTEGIRTELEYRYQTSAIGQVTPAGAFNPDPMIDPNAPFDPDADLKAHFVFSNFFYDFENSSRVTPFVGFGVGGAFVEALSGERDAALAYQGRAGLAIAFEGDYSADLEYVFTRTNTLRYGPSPDDFTPTGPFDPAIDGDNFESSSIMLSLRKQF